MPTPRREMLELCDKDLKAAMIKKKSSVSTFEITETNGKKQKDSTTKKYKFSLENRVYQGEPNKRRNNGKEEVQQMGSTQWRGQRKESVNYKTRQQQLPNLPKKGAIDRKRS